MPRKRRAAREYAGGHTQTEPRDRKKVFGWWLAKYADDIKAGRLPLQVPRGRLVCLLAMSEALRTTKVPSAA